ncbi:MAG: hypothetical protein ICV73_27985 [Acetobacteraceae bacterium]|nr:hypothetical protein [Acetobacteraceae bacterium]
MLVETILPRASGECQTSSPGGPAWRWLAGLFGRLRTQLLRGTLLRRVGRLLEEAERGRGQEAELAGAAGHLLALCARDAWDAREAEWYWGQAIGLLDRLCEVGTQEWRDAARARAERRPEPQEAAP